MARVVQATEKIERLRDQLLEWYAGSRRDLPWRRTPDPYAIWVSEIMLQQTRVAVVVDRYQGFMERFPTLISLALAAISHTDRFCGGRWILAGVESDERLAICSAIGSAGVSKG